MSITPNCLPEFLLGGILFTMMKGWNMNNCSLFAPKCSSNDNSSLPSETLSRQDDCIISHNHMVHHMGTHTTAKHITIFSFLF